MAFDPGGFGLGSWTSLLKLTARLVLGDPVAPGLGRGSRYGWSSEEAADMLSVREVAFLAISKSKAFTISWFLNELRLVGENARGLRIPSWTGGIRTGGPNLTDSGTQREGGARPRVVVSSLQFLSRLWERVRPLEWLLVEGIRSINPRLITRLSSSLPSVD